MKVRENIPMDYDTVLVILKTNQEYVGLIHSIEITDFLNFSVITSFELIDKNMRSCCRMANIRSIHPTKIVLIEKNIRWENLEHHTLMTVN